MHATDRPETPFHRVKIATFKSTTSIAAFPISWTGSPRGNAGRRRLQELKADSGFPRDALLDTGYHAVWRGERTWNGVAILARDAGPVVTRDRLPGDAADKQSRYLEAAVRGVVIGCVYLPNGNPRPGPKFDYKLAWFERLTAHAATLFAIDAPVVLAGDFNVVPTDFDIYPTKSWSKDALVQPASRACFRRLMEQGWTDAIRAAHPAEPMFTFWDYKRNCWPRDAVLRLDHLLLNRAATSLLLAAGVDREILGKPVPAIMHRPG